MSNPVFDPTTWFQSLQATGVQLALPELLWYQRHTRLLDLKPGRNAQSKLAGSYLARSKGRGMEFDEVRHYQPGDDVRAIDWRVTARTGRVHTKLFREERERPVFILTDLSETMRFGSTLLLKSVQAAHLAALLGWHCKAQGDKLGGLVFSEQQHVLLKPLGRSKGVLRYLQALLDVHQQQQTNQGMTLANALAELRRVLRPGSLLYILSDFNQLDDEALRHLQVLKQHNEIHCCQFSDPLELYLPDNLYGEALVSAQQGSTAVVDLNNKLKQRYQQQQQQALAECKAKLLRQGCQWLTLSSAAPLLSQLAGAYHD
ncbi:hypothetical protein AAY72_04370 [Alishewanella sp. WH16-1]|uniref:DUF58 domain-containing protein n=1 Tax=Alishewanella sp. WH16-1 TaxID=1651088 RepID=UPI000709B45E|nr:DUF58 domain-containing protein [Alishewanella sp. WH16-1]KRS22239.1 hypothetical protein AAY72_04370 [Alishewanella sp. WH16-1]